jgi:hypothetical protein
MPLGCQSSTISTDIHDNQFREIAIETMFVYRFLTKKFAVRNTT